jgi:glycosyltransferase involved in cell wall biosynthesis
MIRNQFAPREVTDLRVNTGSSGMPDKILYVITRAERGGAQSHVLELLHASRELYSVALATGESGFLADEARALGIPVFLMRHLVPQLSLVSDSSAFKELVGIVRDFRPHLIHAHSSKAGLVARLVARARHVPCIFTAHGWAFSEGVSLPRKCVALPSEWLAGHLGATTIAVSQYDRALALRCRVGSVDRIETIPNGIRDDSGRASPQAGTPPVITMVARFSSQKDHTTLLQALSKVQTPFRLRLAGDGPLLERTRACAEQLGLLGRTEFLGECANIGELLATAQIFTLISRYEGLPISVLEALRAGLPIVATNTGGVSETVRHGYNGLLVGRGDTVALRNALTQLLIDPALRLSFGNRSRKLFESNFTAAIMVSRTFAVYNRVLNDNSRADTLNQENRGSILSKQL